MFTTTTPKIEFLDLGRKQAELFTSNNLAYCENLVTCSCPREILLLAYFRLVRERKIIPYEDLLQPDKDKARQLTLDIAKGRLNDRQLRELVKSLLAIEYFLNL